MVSYAVLPKLASEWFILKGGGGASRLDFSKWECTVATNGETPDVLAFVHLWPYVSFSWRGETGLSCVSFLLRDSWGGQPDQKCLFL